MNPAPIAIRYARMRRILLLATEEILGKVVSPPELYLSQLIHNLEDTFGKPGGQGLALQIGRVSFKYGLREFGPELGLLDPAFRLLPHNARLKEASAVLAGFFSQLEQDVRVEYEESLQYWHIQHCAICQNRKAESPSCHMVIGFLQEMLNWVSGGKNFIIEETECLARGDSLCTIVVDLHPIG